MPEFPAATYFSKELLEALKANLTVSESTAHKVFNPLCGQCLAERGREVIRKINEQQGSK